MHTDTSKIPSLRPSFTSWQAGVKASRPTLSYKQEMVLCYLSACQRHHKWLCCCKKLTHTHVHTHVCCAVTLLLVMQVVVIYVYSSMLEKNSLNNEQSSLFELKHCFWVVPESITAILLLNGRNSGLQKNIRNGQFFCVLPLEQCIKVHVWLAARISWGKMNT